MGSEGLHDRLRIVVRVVPVALLMVLVLYSLMILHNLDTPILIATGASMNPTIKAGDVLILDKPDILLIDEGDIIAYRGNNGIVIHRVIEVRGDTLITKGDSNEGADAPVSKENYIGRVVYIIPRIGIPFIILSNPLLLSILLIGIILASLFIYYDRKERGLESSSR